MNQYCNIVLKIKLFLVYLESSVAANNKALISIVQIIERFQVQILVELTIWNNTIDGLIFVLDKPHISVPAPHLGGQEDIVLYNPTYRKM